MVEKVLVWQNVLVTECFCVRFSPKDGEESIQIEVEDVYVCIAILYRWGGTRNESNGSGTVIDKKMPNPQLDRESRWDGNERKQIVQKRWSRFFYA